jgi:hypothetical protein
VLRGVAIDKVAKRERWGDEDDEDEGRRSREFALLMEPLTAAGQPTLVVVTPPGPGFMTITGRAATRPDKIDVTPIEEGDA